MSTGWLRGVVKSVPSGDQVVVVAPSSNPVRVVRGIRCDRSPRRTIETSRAREDE